MKTKILNALKTNYANLGLSEKALGGVASVLEKTITDEANIDAAIREASVADLLRIYQSEMDSERGKASKAVKDFEDYKKEHPIQSKESTETETESETLKIIRQMQADNEALKAKFEASEKKAKDNAVISQVRERLAAEGCKAKPVLDLVLNGAAITDEDTADAIAERCKAEYQTRYKEFYGDGAVPPMGGEDHRGGYKPGKFGAVVAALQRDGRLDKD